MARTWRLLVDGAASGPFNMGVDEALFETALREGRPSVRFYRWQGAWLSLGYGQPLDAAGGASRRIDGIGVVRRSTGGRAVLHGCDLTYAVAAPAELLPAGLLPTYALIASAVARALRDLGVAVERFTGQPTVRHSAGFDCFASPATDELCADGRKLVGSAQRRVHGGVLQHGSIRISADPPHVRQALGLADGVATSLAELGCRAGCDDLLRASIGSFRAALGADFERDGLSIREHVRARARGPAPPRSPSTGAAESRPEGGPPRSRKPGESSPDQRPAGSAAPQ